MKILTLARDLRRRKSRDKNELFVVEGVRATEELLKSPLELEGALTAPQLLEAPRGAELAKALQRRAIPTETVESAEFASAAETDSPQGVLVVVRKPRRSLADLPPDWKGVILVLDAVQDPGNVGTIVRTAAALGAMSTVALPGTVDLWNAKVVRSGMGAHFRHHAFHGTWDELDSFRSGTGATLVAADVSGVPVAEVELPERAFLVVGNEGAGLSGEARERADTLVSLPISADVESLNVAVAAGILLHSLKR